MILLSPWLSVATYFVSWLTLNQRYGIATKLVVISPA